ncbi:hypothetical protein E1J38_008020 [Seonamhaeicola sediminis]|uniref:Hydroxyacid dehydrogenase n=1 Tax=Seonamhaeicola sediminis TaxID=2528206 RepID=A0A562YET8_9FLAO|nr:four-carbon acid sugar kinase family protein [Seonamhaeicola sediminis]TWO32804.1 hypothetical protein E1J38_008020 [Seonamhaeicola sediminis]
MRIPLSQILSNIPESEKKDFRSLNKTLFKDLNKACIIVDDDPTGNQTVYDIPLLNSWTVEILVEELKQSPAFFLLTNSRSLSPEKAAIVYKEIAENIKKASNIVGKAVSIISRSDSTLRGHFPLEPSTLQNTLGLKGAVTVFIPVMFEGKRITLNDTHFIEDHGDLIPVNETPFAQDHSFKYSNADLKDYIQEKSNGAIKASDVFSFSLKAIREKNTEELTQDIINLSNGTYCIFNCINYTDLDKISQVLLNAEKKGKQIIYRTSSSFVPSYIGLPPKGLLDVSEILTSDSNHGGLTIVGSYVKKSSDQLKEALKLFNKDTIIEVDIEKVLGDNSKAYIQSLISFIDTKIKEEHSIIVYTSRKLVTGNTTASTINIAASISQALVNIVNGLTIRPKYLIAKGGITSHDLATKGLEMKRSKVIGQIMPGIPVWEMGTDTKFPKLPYIVFPGNVGTNKTLKEVITKLK